MGQTRSSVTACEGAGWRHTQFAEALGSTGLRSSLGTVGSLPRKTGPLQPEDSVHTHFHSHPLKEALLCEGEMSMLMRVGGLGGGHSDSLSKRWDLGCK